MLLKFTSALLAVAVVLWLVLVFLIGLPTAIAEQRWIVTLLYLAGAIALPYLFYKLIRGE